MNFKFIGFNLQVQRFCELLSLRFFFKLQGEQPNYSTSTQQVQAVKKSIFIVQYTVLQIQQAAVERIPACQLGMRAAFDHLSMVHD